MKKTIIKPKSIISSFEKSKYFRPQAITLLEYLKDFAEYLESLDVTALNTKIETETTNRENAVNEEINERELADSELQHDIDNHTSNSVIHVTQEDKNRWNNPSAIPYIELTGASGTLTDAQITQVQADNVNYIMVDNEKFYKMDNKISSGYVAYSHTEKESNYTKIKILTITISTKGWVITEKSINDISITDVSSTDNTVKEINLNGVAHKVEHTEETVLWTNSSPTSEFSAQTVTLTGLPTGKTIKDFEYLVLFVKHATNEEYYHSEEIKIESDYDTYKLSEFAPIVGGSFTLLVDRNGTINSNTMTFDDCKAISIIDGAISVHNGIMIPVKLIGYNYKN